jgi:hypothetical protein
MYEQQIEQTLNACQQQKTHYIFYVRQKRYKLNNPLVNSTSVNKLAENI